MSDIPTRYPALANAAPHPRYVIAAILDECEDPDETISAETSRAKAEWWDIFAYPPGAVVGNAEWVGFADTEAGAEKVARMLAGAKAGGEYLPYVDRED